MVGHDELIIGDTVFYPLDVLDIKDGNYYISKNGEIYSTGFKRLLKHKLDKDGYHQIHLSLNGGKDKWFRISLLMLYKFVGNPPNDMLDPTSEHIDGDIDNNNINNLMWMERSKNSSTRLHRGIGEYNHEAKLTETQVLEIADLILANQSTLQDIANKFGVHKSTVSNIKRKKTWTYLLSGYDFPIKNMESKECQQRKKQQVIKLFREGYTPMQITRMGYNNSSVYRWLCEVTGEK